jgi:hypothetical protein
MLALFLALPILVWLDRRGLFSPSQRVVGLGLYIALVGIVLTPGLAWGHRGDYPALQLASSVLWYGGLILAIVGVVRWWRSAPRASRP